MPRTHHFHTPAHHPTPYILRYPPFTTGLIFVFVFDSKEVQGLGSHRERELAIASSLRERAKAGTDPDSAKKGTMGLDLNLSLQDRKGSASTGAPSTGGTTRRGT